MINKKAKGLRKVNRSLKLLEALGYQCSRTNATMRPFDIVGVNEKELILCSVKTRDLPGTEECERLRRFPAPANTIKMIHRWKDRESEPDLLIVPEFKDALRKLAALRETGAK